MPNNNDTWTDWKQLKLFSFLRSPGLWVLGLGGLLLLGSLSWLLVVVYSFLYNSQESILQLTSNYSIVVSTAIIMLYLVQLVAALMLSSQELSNQIITVTGKNKEVCIPNSPLQWTLKDLRSSGGPWILFIVVIVLPAFLSFISYQTLIFSDLATQETTVSTNPQEALTRLVYHLCVSVILVFITMEASFILSLSKIKGIWAAMLLASMIIDVVSLFFFHSMDNPITWDRKGFEPVGTETFMLIIASFCFLSSFATIVFARASQEMVFEALVSESKP